MEEKDDAWWCRPPPAVLHGHHKWLYPLVVGLGHFVRLGGFIIILVILAYLKPWIVFPLYFVYVRLPAPLFLCRALSWAFSYGRPRGYELIKTCDLDPEKQYLFLMHPHGILSEGFGYNMCTPLAQKEFAALFPGIPWRVRSLVGSATASPSVLARFLEPTNCPPVHVSGLWHEPN
jgi:hypothetical protein